MQANRRRDTKPEVVVRRLLHGAGLRYRVDVPLTLGTGYRSVRADVVFSRARLALFIDGCFWHGCPDHFWAPRSNTDYWTPKITRNQQRDRQVDRLLTASGWTVLRAWEHEDPGEVATRARAAIQ
jgi:DNA mismatch endonuclease (patch repair protein)